MDLAFAQSGISFGPHNFCPNPSLRKGFGPGPAQGLRNQFGPGLAQRRLGLLHFWTTPFIVSASYLNVCCYSLRDGDFKINVF